MSMPKVSLDGTSDFEIPRHVAIIMDGNGRWAAARGLPRAEGHRRGVEALLPDASGVPEVHADWADHFVVTEGEATLIVGGTVTNPRQTGPGETRGTAITAMSGGVGVAPMAG